MPEIAVKKGKDRRSVMVESSANLLDALLAAGVEVNYSCKRGDCGQCIAAVEQGAIVALDTRKPCLSDKGLVHLCNARPLSDLTLQLPHWPQLEGIRQQRSPAKIHRLDRLAANVLAVTLRLPPTAKFAFLPGQHIRVTNRDRLTRSYSLAEPPGADGLLRLHVRTVAGGAFSDYLTAVAKAGDLWQIEGPLGYFFLREEPVVRSVFLATGTGIAPIHAILQALDTARRDRLGDIRVYWGNRHPEDAYLDEKMRALAARWRLHYRVLLSRQPSPGRALHIQDQLALDLAGADALAETVVYACGNAAMINAASEVCRQMGLPNGRFVSDPFVAS